jgi:plastocyanin
MRFAINITGSKSGRRRVMALIPLLWTSTFNSSAQTTPLTATVRGRVEVIGRATSGKSRRGMIPSTVVWLTPLAGSVDPSATAGDAVANPSQTPKLVQKNKSFHPHILVVPAGSMVEFPNRDPFFHNVFSLFEGKRFDLGLYEAGTSRMVKFDKPGISYIFCNIHPEMSAVVLTISTPFYALSNPDGQLSIAGVPYGRYILHVWSEGMGTENAQPLTRNVTVAESTLSLGAVKVPEATELSMSHKNKYGREYDAPIPNNSIYEQQR